MPPASETIILYRNVSTFFSFFSVTFFPTEHNFVSGRVRQMIDELISVVFVAIELTNLLCKSKQKKIFF